MHRSISRLCLLAVAATVGTAVHAQTKADGQWRGQGGAALSLSSGNTDSRSALLNVEASKATQSDKISLGASFNQAKATIGGRDQTTADKWAAFGQYDFNLTPRLFAFGRLGLEGDQLTDLDLRSALAGGLGYKLVDTEATKFDLFGGLGYSTDRYGSRQTIGGKTDTRFSRASVYLGESSQHKLSSTVSAQQRLEIYPGLSGDKAVLAKFSAGLAVAMSSTMSLNVGLTSAYNSKPALGVKKTDTGLFTGVNVKFGAL